MWGLRSSNQKPDSDHPFGYGMNVYFWSFIVALVLFTLGGTYSIYEGVHKIINPEPLKHAGWAVAILVLGFIMELRSFRVCVKEIREAYPGKSLIWFFNETRDPSLLVIFGEDAAALLGLGIAAAFLGLAVATGNPVWDAVGSIIVGVLLCTVAVFLFWETKALLIGQSVDPNDRAALRDFLSDSPLVEHTYEIKTLSLGNSKALLLIRARFKETENALKLLDNINDLEKGLHAAFPQFEMIFVEPDNKFADY
jgi:cation diffusion facilitator family transporter